ncbi:hypothetical protein HpHNI86_00280 [Helicobacter pylori]|nr:hypothetical protein VN0382_08280 [Helicobacter pylori]
MIQIHHADAFEIIKDFYRQNLKVDAIITDPPYNIMDQALRPLSQSKRLHGYFLLLQVYKLYR